MPRSRASGCAIRRAPERPAHAPEMAISWHHSSAPEAGAPLAVGFVDHVPVAPDVAVLTADHEEHEILALARVRDSAWRRRRDVEEPTRTEDPLLAVDLDACRAGVDEVELVLRVVVVVEAEVPGGHHDRVHPEGGAP